MSDFLSVKTGKPAFMDPAAAKAGLKPLPDREIVMWRISWSCNGEDRYVGCGFANKKDAQLAANAISDLIDWNGTPEDIVSRIGHLGTEKLRRTMIEALRW